MTDPLKAFLAAIAPFLGRRVFAWLAAVATTVGVSLPWDEAKITALLLAALSLIVDGAVYWWRHRSDPKAMPKPTRNRALLVAIDKYPSAALNNCVYDAKDWSEYIKIAKGFLASEIVMLLDAQATTANIMAGLKWLAEDYQTGDRRFFAYSGHGTQMPGSREKDGKFEAICPVDFDWTEQHAIRDTDFAAAFGKIPEGAIFDWVSDSCFSGGLADHDKALLAAPGERIRAYPMPALIAARLGSIVGTPVSVHADLNVGFISGCRTNQTSADVDALKNGAFTHYLLAQLAKTPKASLEELASDVRADLALAGFTQRPQADGARCQRPFLE